MPYAMVFSIFRPMLNPLANACVTAGMQNEVILLPPWPRVIGHPEVANVIAVVGMVL
jgi:hypothetical protein